MATQRAVEDFIRERSCSPGSLRTALQDVQELLQSPEVQRSATDVFSPSGLAHSIGKLCKCRGMIQEVQPELHLFRASCRNFFASDYSERDAADEEGEVCYVDAVSMYVIPVPGNTHFYASAAQCFDDDGEAAHSSIATGTGRYRKRGEREVGSSIRDEDNLHRKHVKSGTSAAAASESPIEVTNSGPQLNFPHPPCNGHLRTACVVTALCLNQEGHRMGERFRLNDVVDFYGFQHFPVDQLPVGTTDDFELFSSWNATELSKGLVSRLLCLSYSPVCSLHVRRPLSSSGHITTATMAQVRANALLYLTTRLTRGDALTAEYLLLHLSAHVRSHTAAMPVGDLPLLIRSPELIPSQWSSFLREIVPVAEVLLTGEDLRHDNGRHTMPKYDRVRNYLQTGVLQVANGSHITIDCSSIDPQDEGWHEGMFALAHKQHLLLEYPFQTLELPVDVSLLALDRRIPTKRMHPVFQFALCVRWSPDEGLPISEAAQSPPLSSAAVRSYLDAVRCLGPAVTADEPLSMEVSRSLLEMSNNFPGWNNRDPLLHNNSFSAATALIYAHAASYGLTGFTVENIEAVQVLEKARVERWRRWGEAVHSGAPLDGSQRDEANLNV